MEVLGWAIFLLAWIGWFIVDDKFGWVKGCIFYLSFSAMSIIMSVLVYFGILDFNTSRLYLSLNVLNLLVAMLVVWGVRHDLKIMRKVSGR